MLTRRPSSKIGNRRQQHPQGGGGQPTREAFPATIVVKPQAGNSNEGSNDVECRGRQDTQNGHRAVRHGHHRLQEIHGRLSSANECGGRQRNAGQCHADHMCVLPAAVVACTATVD